MNKSEVVDNIKSDYTYIELATNGETNTTLEMKVNYDKNTTYYIILEEGHTHNFSDFDSAVEYYCK